MNDERIPGLSDASEQPDTVPASGGLSQSVEQHESGEEYIRMLTRIDEYDEWVENQSEINLVPTMGALHEGHLSLVEAALESSGETVVSVFVNPTQFGKGEDLEKYPRTLNDDVALLTALAKRHQKMITIFAPNEHQMYPDGASSQEQTTVKAGEMGNVFEGRARPGHFDGMLTIVMKLFLFLKPTRAFFGKKDAQQLYLVKRMVNDFRIPTEIVGMPIIREPDGLAKSSRNRYLDEKDRKLALTLYRSLKTVEEHHQEGVHDALEAGLDVLASSSEIKLDYLVAVHPESFTPLPADYRGRSLVMVAAVVGTTRLLDNLEIDFIKQ